MYIQLSVLVVTTVIVAGSPVMNHACGPAQYSVGQECCPMCAPGSCVHKHCTDYSSTLCVPCPPSSYTDGLNALLSCSSCGTCHSSKGLREKKSCSSSSDTLCEPLDGHYCTDPFKDGCRVAVEHTKCSPGQFVRQNGSASSDTVCGDCGNDTYSDGSFTSCRPHTQCQTLGMDVLREGTLSSDAECGKRRMFIVISSVVVLMVLAAILFLWLRPREGGGALPPSVSWCWSDQQDQEDDGRSESRATSLVSSEG